MPAAGSARLMETLRSAVALTTVAHAAAEVGPAEAAVLAAPRAQPPTINRVLILRISPPLTGGCTCGGIGGPG